VEPPQWNNLLALKYYTRQQVTVVMYSRVREQQVGYLPGSKSHGSAPAQAIVGRFIHFSCSTEKNIIDSRAQPSTPFKRAHQSMVY
jgi:hypothetical protein